MTRTLVSAKHLANAASLVPLVHAMSSPAMLHILLPASYGNGTVVHPVTGRCKACTSSEFAAPGFSLLLLSCCAGIIGTTGYSANLLSAGTKLLLAVGAGALLGEYLALEVAPAQLPLQVG